MVSAKVGVGEGSVGVGLGVFEGVTDFSLISVGVGV